MSSNGHSNAWTDERLTRLDELWREGMNAGEIAAALTTETTPKAGRITRNAVLGKIHRRRQVLGGGASLPLRPRRPGPKRRRAPAAPRVRQARPRPLPPAPPPAPPVPRNLPLLQLTDTYCRWPIGDVREPGFVFCAADKPELTQPYCTEHARLAYTAPRP